MDWVGLFHGGFQSVVLVSPRRSGSATGRRQTATHSLLHATAAAAAQSLLLAFHLRAFTFHLPAIVLKPLPCFPLLSLFFSWNIDEQGGGHVFSLYGAGSSGGSELLGDAAAQNVIPEGTFESWPVRVLVREVAPSCNCA